MVLSREQFFRSLAAGTILLAPACGAPGTVAPARPAEAFVPMASLRPVAVSLTTGATQTFQAEINLPEGASQARPPIGWRVVEPAGGTISTSGLYTAPSTAGVFHVQVRREDFPEITATATVTVK
jgi:hypothetical protein